MAGVPFRPGPNTNLLPQEWERGALLPIEKGSEGGFRPAIPQALLDLLDAFMLPGDVAQGNVDPMSEEGIGRAAGFTGNLGAMGLASGAGQGVDPNLLNVFAGPKAKTADLLAMNEAYTQALSMAKMNSLIGKKGLTGGQNDKLFADTGWFVGPDGKMRFEISDAPFEGQGNFPRVDATLLEKALQYKETYPNGDWLRMAKTMTPEQIAGNTYAGQTPETVGSLFSHPELFAAYPDIADIPTRLRAAPIAKMEGEHIPMHGGKERIFAQAPSEDELLSVMIHEIQHAVQDREGFAQGGNPEWTGQMLAQIAPGAADQLLLPDPYNIYKALTGEVEARNVQDRMMNSKLVGNHPEVLEGYGHSIKQAVSGKLTPYTRVPGLPPSEAGAYDVKFPLMVDPADLGMAASNAKDGPSKEAMRKKLQMLFQALNPDPLIPGWPMQGKK